MIIKAIVIIMQTSFGNIIITIYKGGVSPQESIYPLTTSLVFALKDSLNGISTTTASTGVPGVSEYTAGK